MFASNMLHFTGLLNPTPAIDKSLWLKTFFFLLQISDMSDKYHLFFQESCTLSVEWFVHRLQSRWNVRWNILDFLSRVFSC